MLLLTFQNLHSPERERKCVACKNYWAICPSALHPIVYLCKCMAILCTCELCILPFLLCMWLQVSPTAWDKKRKKHPLLIVFTALTHRGSGWRANWHQILSCVPLLFLLSFRFPFCKHKVRLIPSCQPGCGDVRDENKHPSLTCWISRSNNRFFQMCTVTAVTFLFFLLNLKWWYWLRRKKYSK